jgi:hypothetical protein
VIERSSTFSAFYSGYAHFGADPRAGDKVGEFHDVYGRKKAKEECTKRVLQFLLGLEELNLRVDGVWDEEKEGEMKRRKTVGNFIETRG